MPDPWRSRIVGHGEADPASLTRNPRNWRTHPRPQLDALAGVLTEVGWVQDVILNRTTGHVVDGHARIDLALSRKEPTVPVVYVDLSPEEEGKVLATLDPLGAMAGADTEALGRLLDGVRTDDAALRSTLRDLAEEHGLEYGGDGLPGSGEAPEPEIDRAEELRAKWGTAPGQLWVIGRHRLLCGDATKAEDVERLMDGERAVACVTDPPYSVGYEDQEREPGRTTRRQGGDAYRDPHDAGTLLRGFIELLPSDVLVMTYAWNRHFQELAQATRGFDLLYECVWVKHHFAFIIGRRYQPQHEPILIFRRRGKIGTFHVPADQSTVFAYDKPASNPDHPTAKPLELWAQLVVFHSDVGDRVYDPFLGSGTSVVACEQTGRVCHGLEVEPSYVAVTLERLSKMGLEPRLEP